jgi:hypothetical protein
VTEPIAAVASSDVVDSTGMRYLESLPRRIVTIYVPIAAFLIVAAVPVLLDGDHDVQAERRAVVARGQSVLGEEPDARAHPQAAVRHRVSRLLWNTVLISVVATFISLTMSVLAAYAIERLRFRGSRYVGMSIFLAYLVPPSILFIPLATIIYKLESVRHAARADPHVPDVPDPVLHVAPDGLLQVDPARARGMRADRRREPAADPRRRSSCRSPCRG